MSAGGVTVKASGAAGARTAGLGGLHTCGSVWACPVCSAKINATRHAELLSALGEARRRSLTVSLVTLTMRHHAGQSLAELWDALGYAWSAVTSGRAWVGERDRYGVRGWCRLVEVTHGENGWHVHVHALVFTDGASRWAPADLGPLMFDRWRSALVRKGLRPPSAGFGGLDVKVLTGDLSALGDYFTKNVYLPPDDEALALEVARPDLKDARDGNRAPFRVLADVVAVGEARDLALWHEYESASHGRRQLTWSRGWRADLLAGLAEQTDEEIAAEDVGGDVLLVLDAAEWDRRVRREPGLTSLLLSLAETDEDGTALRRYLDVTGWPWSVHVPDPGGGGG